MNDIQKAIQDARGNQNSRIYNQFSNSKDLETPEDVIVKSEDSVFVEEPVEEEVEKSEGSDDKEPVDSKVEKSEIMDSLDYGSTIKVSKTGKELKEQAQNVILPELKTELAVTEGELTKKLEACGAAPTKETDTYWRYGMKAGFNYKRYDWNELYMPEKNRMSMETLSSADAADKQGNLPLNEAQVSARQDYNCLLRKYCGVLVDIKACEILQSLKDETEYELTPRQIVTFQL